jgi:UDP-N-acetylmuramate dehydrogenase
VIAPLNALRTLKSGQAGEIYAEVGVTSAKLAKFANRQGLARAEFFAGIPGTVGGALAMNAGAFGGETWTLVSKVLLINRHGELIERDASSFEIAYRSVSIAENEWFVACYLSIPVGDDMKGREKIRQLLAKRAQTQPTKMPSGGSVFKNPEGDHAARLIEATGLKGKQIGGAQVSEKHANFILNTGNASAADIEQLIAFVKEQVKLNHGVELETEVRIIGEELNE